jgi:hypothetical protein
MGFSARLFIMPEAGRGTVLLTNQRPSDDELAGGATTCPDVRYVGHDLPSAARPLELCVCRRGDRRRHGADVDRREGG